MKRIYIAFAAALALGSVCVCAAENEVPFDLHAYTYDYGESINRITFTVEGIDPSSLTNETFTVVSSSALPEGIEGDEMNFGLYESVERTVDAVSVTGNVVELNLHCENGGSGEGTLSYSYPNIQKNMDMVLTYEITQAADIVAGGETIPAGTLSFVQNEGWDNPEVDAFQSESLNGMTYYFYVPENADDGELHPLVLWLHGYGEGGYEGVESTTSGLRANRAAICFAGDEAQAIFGGAFVLAPQAPTSWMEGLFPEDYAGTLLAILDKMTQDYPVDVNRVYVCGASSGGYGTFWMGVKYPERWAAVIPICPAIGSDNADAYGASIPTDEEVQVLGTVPTWTIQSADDPSVPIDGASRRIAQVLGSDVIYSEYSVVNVDGVAYNGHWSWIYFEQNLPIFEGQHIWQWMAAQSK